ncbi:MAG: alpha/beta fold hydrolase [Promethearchaeota archaeon]
MENEFEAKLFQLSDGRTLAYSEYGDLQGHPVFLFHGSPGSRLEGIHAHKPGIKNKFHVIAPDRPGMGKSDFQKGRAWIDWPKDVTELADHLRFEKFGVMGGSGGSPPVLVCAYLIPDRLDFAVVMGGWAPNIDGKLYRNLAPIERNFGRMVRFPVIFRLFYGVLGFIVKHQNDEKLMKNFQSSMCEADKKMIEEDHEMTVFLANDIKESFRQGARGPSHDAILQYRDWGFNLENISIPVHLYHGMEDKFAPYAFAEFLHGVIPNSILKSYPGEGHFSILNMIGDVFKDMNRTLNNR